MVADSQKRVYFFRSGDMGEAFRRSLRALTDLVEDTNSTIRAAQRYGRVRGGKVGHSWLLFGVDAAYQNVSLSFLKFLNLPSLQNSFTDTCLDSPPVRPADCQLRQTPTCAGESETIAAYGLDMVSTHAQIAGSRPPCAQTCSVCIYTTVTPLSE